MPDTKWNSIGEFAASVKEKFPAYKSWNDADLARAMFEKFPEYIPQVQTSVPFYRTDKPTANQPSGLEKLSAKVQQRHKNPLEDISQNALRAQEAAVARGDVNKARLHAGVESTARLTNQLVTDPTNIALGAAGMIPGARLAMAPVMGALGLHGMIKSGTNIADIGQETAYAIGLTDKPGKYTTPEAAQQYLQSAAMLLGGVAESGEMSHTEATARAFDKMRNIYEKAPLDKKGNPKTPYAKTAAEAAGSVAGAVTGYTAGGEMGHPLAGGYFGRKAGEKVGGAGYEVGRWIANNVPKGLRSKAFKDYQNFLNEDLLASKKSAGPGKPPAAPGGSTPSPTPTPRPALPAAGTGTPTAAGAAPAPSRVQAEFTPEGNIRLGGANERGWKIMGGSLYKDRSPKTVVKELLQNAFDAVRGTDNGVVHVDMQIKYPELEQTDIYLKKQGVKNFDYNYDNGRPVLTVTDTGKGMSHEEVGTVLTNIFQSGKGTDVNASGGFGVAKAAIFNIPDRVRVETTTKLTKGRYQTTTFEGSFDELVSEKGVKPTVETKFDPLGRTKTGTKIEATLPKGEGFWEVEQFTNDAMNKSLNPPGQLSYSKYGEHPKTADISNRPTELMHETSIGGTKIKIFKSKETDERMFQGYGINVEINNKGIYQFTTQVPLPGEISGVPKRIAVDINTTHPEESADYPFSASREELKSEIRGKIAAVIHEEIIKPAIERTNNLVDHVYNNLPKITEKAVVYDAGGRLEPDEMANLQNNPVVRQLADHLHAMGTELLSTLSGSRELQAVHGGKNPFGAKIDRWGFVLSDAVHGVNISNKGMSNQTVLINPFSSKQLTPSGVASMMFHTLKHEINHEAISGHNASFTTSLAHIDENVPVETTIEFLQKLKATLSGPNGELHPDYVEARRMYHKSRQRPTKGGDIFAKDIEKEGRGY